MAYENRENSIISLCILATLQAKIVSTPKAIVKIIYELKEKGIDIGQIFFQRVASGYDSPSIKNAIGSYFIAGLLSNENPILITPLGLKEFKEMVYEFFQKDPETLSQIAKIIGIDLAEIKIVSMNHR